VERESPPRDVFAEGMHVLEASGEDIPPVTPRNDGLLTHVLREFHSRHSLGLFAIVDARAQGVRANQRRGWT